uniref:SNF2 family N-terminal domain protein n=1 Tax=Megaviridae environmental sample TaxID=1737588 RepID=A0A5J6VI30_9VIRU|nr:MAG: SNF2 family N-terminal domain protein [Megaviridae environmental sample]
MSYVIPSDPRKGKLFPQYIIKMFNDLIMPPLDDSIEDKCNVNEDRRIARNYQKFISRYLSYESPYRNILIYHGMGSGKTISAINLYNALYNHNPEWNVIILIKSSLLQGWEKKLNDWLQKENKRDRMSNVQFITYNSATADKKFLEVQQELDPTRKNLYIIDEAHNFIRNTYNNIQGNGNTAKTIYETLQRQVIEHETDTRLILLSGTPLIQDAFEAALLFNLLRPNSFPRKENEFNRIFINDNVLNPKMEHLFMRRILGLVSYYYGKEKGAYAQERNIHMDIPMSEYQTEMYKRFEKEEAKLRAKRKASYRVTTRAACNFCFPMINEKINAESRPRPSKFKITMEEAKELSEKGINGDQEGTTNVKLYLETCKRFISETQKYFLQLAKKHNYLKNDLKEYLKYKNFIEYLNKAKKSPLFNELYKCSSKMTAMLFFISRSKGKVVVYSNNVKMEGLEVFKIYLEAMGYQAYGKNKTSMYVEYHGSISDKQRNENLKAFNSSNNIRGERIRVLLLGPAGSEGLDMTNIRQLFIMEPFWHEGRLDQVIGRGIRFCSHKELPMKERIVDLFHMKASIPNSRIETADEYMRNMEIKKASRIKSIEEVMKKASVDCFLFRNHHNNLECFNFSNQDILRKNTGPAYSNDIDYDVRHDNNKLVTESVQVRRIKVIINDTDQPIDGLLQDSTGIVFHNKYHYPIGILEKDNHQNFDMWDMGVYKMLMVAGVY